MRPLCSTIALLLLAVQPVVGQPSEVSTADVESWAATLGSPDALPDDLRSGLAWSGKLQLEQLDPPLATLGHLAQLKASSELSRYDLSLTSTRWLAEHAPESFHMDVAALLAAARAHEATGLHR